MLKKKQDKKKIIVCSDLLIKVQTEITVRQRFKKKRKTKKLEKKKSVYSLQEQFPDSFMPLWKTIQIIKYKQ